ncbi:TPA: restriction endonuclease subunit S [Klebsiella pneumoniae]|uniref:restriction endonuclease subunit S n=1 Tax=Klebsiella TaxID=570 RepID=UPI000B4130B6|nr:restriction endonuclease subunit S [Klebsiella pneumoniae]HDT3517599.1 restriction endonuclease subunit S [Klebsiella pneumoniae subsp. pneumoniae]ELA2288050.1 restriction endonuclease subunit S [Klebsiella pneumoniae]ELA2487599.1 restriction endonuclease subunit S [Klebsiella pneumoniae]MCP5698258.1 restriction endonuclease subunit S [Klebsiella pneumoniae]MCQ8515509.1 restriction endonuclease subunit S [Klebsiella pneumoniae]
MAKYKAYPEYKDSGVEWLGEVPGEWDVINIKYLSQVKRGASPRPIDDPKFFDDDGDYAWVRIADVTASDTYLLETTQKMSALGSSLSVKLEPNKLFLSIAGTVGKPCITAIRSCIHDGFVYFPYLKIPNKFLFYVFAGEQAYKGLGKMGTQLNLNTDTVGGIKVALPSNNDFIANIVNFLDHETAKIDNLIEKQQQLIELLKEKRQAVISHAVTKGLNPDAPMKDSGVEWLGEVPEHWTVTRLGYHAIKIGSGKTPRGGSEIYLDEGVLFLRSQNIYDDGLRVESSECVFIDLKTHNEMKGTRVLEGDILLNITGASIGRSCIVPTPFVEANVNQHVCILRFTENIRDFISYAMKSSSTKEQIEACQVGGNREGLNFEQASKINICLPPEEEIGAVLGYLKIRLPQLDTLEKKAANIILLLQERRTALISAAVTGKIDVRDWVAPDTQDVKEPQEASA